MTSQDATTTAARRLPLVAESSGATTAGRSWLTDTIVAVSSPPGRSARGLVRLSGPLAFDILQQLLADPPTFTPRHLQSARLRTPPLPVLVAVFPGPQSYTTDDIAELQLPGHPALLDRVIHAALDAGARLAEAGEFTFRAYTAGRLDLTQAEGVAATIHAMSDGQLAAAEHLRSGELARFTVQRVERLGTLLALVEAGIDFVDQEDVVPIAPRKLAEALQEQQKQLADLLGCSRSWGTVEALPRVVLVGPPSSGKSTLFNALLGRSRAVIDAAPGTTRDVLEEPLTLGLSCATPGVKALEQGVFEGNTSGAGAEIMLCDIAGLDTAEGALDRDIQQRAAEAIRTADLVLQLGNAPLPADLTHHNTLRIYAKADLESAGAHRNPDTLHVSAHTGQGLDQLHAAITDRLGDRAVSVRAELLALQPRHEAALHAASAFVAEALVHIDPEAHALGEIELVAGAMRDALNQLASLGGELTPDDVIGRVFSTFCVGK